MKSCLPDKKAVILSAGLAVGVIAGLRLTLGSRMFWDLVMLDHNSCIYDQLQIYNIFYILDFRKLVFPDQNVIDELVRIGTFPESAFTYLKPLLLTSQKMANFFASFVYTHHDAFELAINIAVVFPIGFSTVKNTVKTFLNRHNL